MYRSYHIVLTLTFLFAAIWAGQGMAFETSANLKAQGCGSLKNAYGPFDYNTAYGRKHWEIVESHHFTESVRTLKHGSTGKIPNDLDYTLRAFPNQPAALYDMAIYQLQHGYPPAGTHDTTGYYSAACYFKRAMAFAPKDGVVRMVYAIYLQRQDKDKIALKLYQQAEKLIPPARAGELHYDMGLLYFKMKDYEKAREEAKNAYSGGYPLPGLRNQLKAAGQWSADVKGANRDTDSKS